MSEYNTIPMMKDYRESSLCHKEDYEKLYKQSIENSDEFWAKQAESLDWIKKWDQVSNCSYNKNNLHIEWFKGGQLNISYNCIDRHLKKRANQIAFYWEADDPNSPHKEITYQDLSDEVCKLANAMKANGVKKGDRVTIYMPMIPEAIYSMLACTRIGAIHSVVFGGFSPEALAGRINDCESDFIITADEGLRGGKKVALKANVDKALESCPHVRNVLVVQHTKASIPYGKKDLIYQDEISKQSNQCEIEIMDAEDPLFILYTSGSTGKPKGVLHSTAGYLLYASMTHKYVFDYQEGDIYWCTADVGWITGHSYIAYGPLANGATSVIFEGIPTYPDASRHWQIVDKFQVNQYYTAPTAIRALMAMGNDYLKNSKRTSLKLLGTVGEPINPEAWEWYFEEIGFRRCPIVDTWWQTETGGILITPLPAARDLKPGSATLAFFGIEPVIVDNEGKVLTGPCNGNLCLKRSWPGQMRTVYKDHDRFVQTYFSSYDNLYFTGDGCHRDEDGYIWITGRVDDVINVSGHRMGTAEVESALVEHTKVAEAAVVGYPHDIKGQGIYAYVILNQGEKGSDELQKELISLVRSKIGPIASPDFIHFSNGLPKTRSGKIMRRILRKIAGNDFQNLGDISTLAEPAIVQELIDGRVNK